MKGKKNLKGKNKARRDEKVMGTIYRRDMKIYTGIGLNTFLKNGTGMDKSSDAERQHDEDEEEKEVILFL